MGLHIQFSRQSTIKQEKQSWGTFRRMDGKKGLHICRREGLSLGFTNAFIHTVTFHRHYQNWQFHNITFIILIVYVLENKSSQWGMKNKVEL